jgi:hypothetical protein
MYKYLCIILILLTATSAFTINAQSPESILLPFKYDEVWNTDVINGRDDYGVHKDRLGVGLDFYTDRSAMVLAPISGELEQGCSSKGVTLVAITNSSGLKIRLLHILENTLKQTSGYIKQGSPIAMTAPRGDYNGTDCNISSDDYHVHMGIATVNTNNCAYNIDGYNFYCAGMRQCDNSLDGSYKLSFGVQCNRKYLNQKFVSTNGFPLSNDQCKELIKNANGSMPKDETNILNLQVCLTKANLYIGVYSRQYDDYTKDKVNQYLGANPQGPTQAELDAKAELAKKIEAAKAEEDARLAAESRRALEVNKAEEEKLKKEAETQRTEKKVEIQQVKEDITNSVVRTTKEKEVQQNITRNILILLTLAAFIVATTIALLLTIKHKKKKKDERVDNSFLTTL